MIPSNFRIRKSKNGAVLCTYGTDFESDVLSSEMPSCFRGIGNIAKICNRARLNVDEFIAADSYQRNNENLFVMYEGRGMLLVNAKNRALLNYSASPKETLLSFIATSEDEKKSAIASLLVTDRTCREIISMISEIRKRLGDKCRIEAFIGQCADATSYNEGNVPSITEKHQSCCCSSGAGFVTVNWHELIGDILYDESVDTIKDVLSGEERFPSLSKENGEYMFLAETRNGGETYIRHGMVTILY